MNILLVGYCNLEDGFLYASNSLKKLQYKIFFFPYHSYILDNNNDIDNILDNFIKNNDINIILWWNNNIQYETIRKIKNNHDVKNIFFNWDPFLYEYEKYNSFVWKDKIDSKIKYYPLMDNVLSCFEKEILFFKNKCNIHYSCPGFDKDVSKYDYVTKYDCDISIVCTNLYDNLNEFPDQSTNITRYYVVNKIYENRKKLKFHIYGNEKFKNMFPDCYKGFVKYEDCNKIFSSSKINLCIHPLIYELNNTPCKEEYFSERLPQILGSKGLLVTNSLLTNYLKKDIDYVYIDNTFDWFEKLMHIIKNNHLYNFIRENGYKKGMMYYQWNNWALTVNNCIKKKILKLLS